MGMTIDKAIKHGEEQFWRDISEHNEFIQTAVETMRKYQKIQKIVESKTTRVSYDIGFRQIKKVVEDGKID